MRACLTPAYVDSLEQPPRGELWIADATLKGFGVRLWAGKKGGGSAYAIRVRDHTGRLVRESFAIWSSHYSWFTRRQAIELYIRGEAELSLGLFLEDAREWARDRLTVLRGGMSRADRRRRRYERASTIVQTYTLDAMAERAFAKLQRSGRNPDYVVQLIKLFGRVPQPLRLSLMTKINVRLLADVIADPDLPSGQSRALQAFVGQLYAQACKWHGPIGRSRDALNRRVYHLRRKSRPPPYPEINDISDGELESLFCET